MLQAALYEFSSLNTLLDATEAYVGVPYAWGVYQLLVMPRSFPFGGMENPLMTFVSPTVVTGTRSQVYVVIHEIAHSWTGNMVTMNNWSDFWLNEGYTTFIERQVSARLYGGDFANVEGLLGNTTIINTVNLLGANDTYATIHPVLFGDNPDNSFNEMPYEKGY
jgi:leukotriene-A4 hydrolase